MTSDEKHRDVALALRRVDVFVDPMDDAEICGRREVEHALGLENEDEWYRADDVQHLADLIDLKTCEFKPTYESLHGFVTLVECSECGWKTEPWNAEEFRYCPNCGAEVVEKEEDDER